MAGVRVLKVSRVTLQPGTYPPPGETVQLSFFDSIWVGLPHVQRLFLYLNTSDASFPTILDSLKSSLARILPSFHPFAGKVTYIPSDGTAVIDCSASAIGEGVAVIEAESDLDILRIAKEDVHDESFVKLVPNIDVPELPTDALAVQVTRFSKGGVALGIAVHHTVADGKGLWQFFEAWFSTCRTGSLTLGSTPVHDRAVIEYPGSDEIAKDFIRKMAPALPKILAPSHSLEDRHRTIRRTFSVERPSIMLWKKLAGDEAPSTFVSIAARVMVTIATVRGLAHDDGPLIAGFLIDCRSRLDPPIDDGYTGNCVSFCFVQMVASEVAGPDGFVTACVAFKEVRFFQMFTRIRAQPLVGCEGWPDKLLKLPSERVVRLAGSPRFKAFEADFGWGEPGRVELLSMNHDGGVAMVAGKDEGTVQVSVSLSVEHMNAFADKFLT